MRHGDVLRIAFGLLALALYTPAASRAQDVTSASYLHSHRLVSIDGDRRLNLFCVGHGAPAVVFVSGLGGGAIDWRRIQGPIGQATTACSYDRAGYGFSDKATRPSDATDAADDLHRLLHAAGIRLPVVLVGHSIGGLYATLAATLHPADVAGLVLVDPSFAGQDAAIRQATGPALHRLFDQENAHVAALLESCVALARDGRLAQPAQAGSACLDNPPNPDPAVHAALTAESEREAYETAVRSEMANVTPGPDGVSPDTREVEVAHPDFGSIPVVVLTASDHPLPPIATPAEIVALKAAQARGHRALASLSTDGRVVTVAHSGHFIQLDRPAAVIDAVDQVIARLRQRRAAPLRQDP